MYLRDNPGEFDFKRLPDAVNDDGLDPDMRLKLEWARVSIGAAAEAFWKPNLPSEKVLEKLRQMRRPNIPTVGVRRFNLVQTPKKPVDKA